LDIAARNRETVLRSAYLKAKRQTERGAEGEVAAYVIPADQHDPLTMKHMVNKLLGQGIEVLVSEGSFTHEGRVYGAGSYAVSMAQPKRGVIRWLLGQTNYPDNSYTRDREGNPIRPYDMSTDNMAEFMGVAVHPVATPVTGLQVVDGTLTPEGAVASAEGADSGLRIDGRQNAAFKAVNLLWDEGAVVRRADADGATLRAGDFVVPGSTSQELLTRIAMETGVSFEALDQDPTAATRPARRQRLAMYQRYYGGNMDEGWTRWLLEDFRFPYTTLMDDRILDGNLRRDFDVIILPADRVAMMTGNLDGAQGGRRRTDPSDYPPEYRSGFGDEGVQHLEDFVRNGGTLVTFAEAGDLPIQEFDLPVRNALAGVAPLDFWSPGSTLHVKVDNKDRFAYGMPDQALAAFLANNQVYEVSPGAESHTVKRIVEFVDRDLLQSGWLLGEERIANRATMVSVRHGQGTVLLVGFRAQHRAQTHGTFKLIFNAFVSGPEGGEVAAATGR
ncbi:MAG: peptidase M14 family protein, partial [Longimicrobiales bacterium]